MNFAPVERMRDRQDAGRRLAARLAKIELEADAVILALPRGGVPVAAEVAHALRRRLDVLVVRKLGVPGHEELAMGAIAAGGVEVLNRQLIASLGLRREQIEAVVARETAELARRETRYRNGRQAEPVAGRTVVVIDDGVATGSTMSAAIALLRQRQARRIIVAVPVAPPDTVRRLRDEADAVVTLLEPFAFSAVGQWYDDFSQTSDEEVTELLANDCPPVVSSGERSASVVRSAIRHVRDHAQPLTGAPADFDGVLDLIGEAGIVLIGEASHGTHDFYQLRAELTKRLIESKGFIAVAAEADWPDAYRVNRFVRGDCADADATGALAGFGRFPSWMWRNAEVLDFIGWLRSHNERVYAPERQVGFYGLDLYSLHKSIDEVIAYLEQRDPAEAANARALYGCIDRFGRDPQNYGLLTGTGVRDDCHDEVVQQLTRLRRHEAAYLGRDGATAAEEFFFAEQNALLVRNAENYYRQMFRSDVSSWNLRDEHMLEMLVGLTAHLQSHYGEAKVVVWAHNSHVGDARATELAVRGELNLGQLVRQGFGDQARLLGFTTFAGSVAAASGWHLPLERKQVRPAIHGSYEHLFHQIGIDRFWLDLRENGGASEVLLEPRLERAIGVVYLPESERHSHYFQACLPRQFDAVIHCDLTRAVEPLEHAESWEPTEAPETFPAGV